jgi:hypothetical protein
VAVARAFGKCGSRLSVAVSLVSLWLAAWVLWTFAAGLAACWRAIAWYDSRLFGVFALAGGVWHYRTHVRAGRDRGLAVFGERLAGLFILLIQNGAFSER